MKEYKGFKGSIEYSEIDGVYHGRVIGIDSLVTFESISVEGLEVVFKDAVDDYLHIVEEIDEV